MGSVGGGSCSRIMIENANCSPLDHITVRALSDGIDFDITGAARPVSMTLGLIEFVLKALGEDAEKHVGRTTSRVSPAEQHRTIGPAATR